MTETFTPVEEAALAVWRADLGYEPTEPLRTKGGALDPQGWSMKVAIAVAECKPLPLRFKDVRTQPSDPAVLVAHAVLDGRAAPERVPWSESPYGAVEAGYDKP